MSMTPERVAERVEELIGAIRHGEGSSCVQRDPGLTMDYIRQVFERGVINHPQLSALVAAVKQAGETRQPEELADGEPLARVQGGSECNR